MESLFRADSYHFEPLAIPFMVACLAIAAMMAVVAVLRGATILRLTFLGVCLSLMPFVAFTALAASSNRLDTAELASKLALAPTPMAGAFAMLFDLALARKLPRHVRLAVVAVVLSAAAAVICVTTDWVQAGVGYTPTGLPFGRAAWLAPLFNAMTGCWVAIGTWVLWRNLPAEASALRRRQFKGAMWAFSISALGVVDILLAFGIGYYPVSWLCLTIGAVIAMRSLIADDLIHAASLDPAAVGMVLFAALSGTGLWVISSSVGARPLAGAVSGVVLFALLRAGHATARYLASSGVVAVAPLEGAVERYGHQLQSIRVAVEVADAMRAVVHEALGAEQVSLLVPSEDDYSWRAADGAPLSEHETPDPLLLGWLVEHRRPLVRDELVGARLGELRGPIERLFAAHDAEVITALTSRDALVGLLVIGPLPGGRALRPDELGFLEGVRDRTEQALVYASMWRETQARVEFAKEVELTATVQAAFVPASAAADYGDVRVCGIYAPATRCGGDWWSAHVVVGNRTLVLVGDVTGHGIAAAMVTAAAKGCYDVALRLMGDRLDLVELMQQMHHAVRRTGGSQFYMTCFAALIDPRAGTVSFSNAGHVAPYVLRRLPDGGVKLDVLVARGNPLGASAETPRYKAQTRELSPGDVVVWYTDGIVECMNHSGEQWGERRFQRTLKHAAAEGADVEAIRDRIVRDAALFNQGRAPDDDITLVVGRVNERPS